MRNGTREGWRAGLRDGGGESGAGFVEEHRALGPRAEERVLEGEVGTRRAALHVDPLLPPTVAAQGDVDGHIPGFDGVVRGRPSDGDPHLFHLMTEP